MQQKEKLFIIKIGGNVIDNDTALEKFLTAFSTVSSKKILVHGGGKIATSIGEKLGIQSEYILGRRVTNDETIDLVTMVYGGLINKKIVASLQKFQCNAIGVSGADGNLIPATKRSVTPVNFGWVGDIDSEKIPVDLWKHFIENQLIPIVAPLTHDEEGHLLNTNADTIAASISMALSKVYETHLIYCFEKDGVLTDVNNEHSLITFLDDDLYHRLKSQEKLFAGILPKLENAFFASARGVSSVIIGNSNNLPDLVSGSAGTIISN